MIIPTKPFKRRLPADCVFEISPPEKKYSQPAMMMLKKKTRPAIRNMKSMTPPTTTSEKIGDITVGTDFCGGVFNVV